MSINKLIVDKGEDGIATIKVGDNGIKTVISHQPITEIEVFPQATGHECYGKVTYIDEHGAGKKRSLHVLGECVEFGEEIDR